MTNPRSCARIRVALQAALILSATTAGAQQQPDAACSSTNVSGCGSGVGEMWKRLRALQNDGRRLGDGESAAGSELSYVKSDGRLDATIAMRRYCALQGRAGAAASEACASLAVPVNPSNRTAMAPPIDNGIAPRTEPPSPNIPNAVDGTAMPADGKCMTPAEIAAYFDPDFKRNSATLSHPNLCVTIKRIADGPLKWTLEIVQNKARSKGPLWAVPHDSEDEAFSTGAYGVLTYGGTMVAVEAGEQRESGGQDPNRNFGARTAPGACPRQRAPAPEFTRAFMDVARESKLIIALHNNMPVGGTISMKAPAGNETPFFARPNPNVPSSIASPKHIVYIAGRAPATSPKVQEEAKWLNDNGVNVMYETVTEANNDCSMSNFVALKSGDYRYYNIEAPRGARDQTEVLKVLMRHIDIAPNAGGELPPTSQITPRRPTNPRERLLQKREPGPAANDVPDQRSDLAPAAETPSPSPRPAPAATKRKTASKAKTTASKPDSGPTSLLPSFLTR